MDTSVEVPAAATRLVPFQVNLDFEISVNTWADSAIAFLETTTEERQRIAVRDEAVRIVALAEAAGGGVSVALANEILQRAIRKIGKGSPRRRAGRPAQAAGDNVRGDMIPASELPAGGHRPARPEQNRSPRGTISGDGSTAAAGDLPKATRSAYRKDAEELSDEGFERLGSSVRAAAQAAPAAGHKLDRATVRAAGAVEAAGGDPGDLQAVTAKKRVLSDSRKLVIARAGDDAAPATQNQRPDRDSDPAEAANAQSRPASPNEAGDPGSKGQDQARVEPASDERTRSDATRSQGERSGTGVTAKQSARDRSNRIVSVVAEDAKTLTAQEDLIDFTALDQTQLPKWIEDLEDARRLLGRFIRRLRQEVEDGLPSAPVAD